jgi:chitin disaccharide deacetylase
MNDSTRILIVNADDFGRSSGVNRGVVIAHEQGIVTSASLMVRRPAAEEAAAYARQHPRLSCGLHLDLGEWIYRDGSWEAIEEVAGPVEVEVRRQLESFQMLVGHEPTHLDSHQHVHRQAPAGAVVAELARELGIPLRACERRIRFCGDFYGQTSKGEPLPAAISVEALLDLLAALQIGVTELGCHPGLGTDDDLPYGRERSIELRSLCDPRIRSAVLTYGIELRSFAEI